MRGNRHITYKILKGFVFLIVLSALISLLFSGPRIFYSFRSYLYWTSYGFTVGLVLWLGNWSLGTYAGKKLNWRKNARTSNLIALSMFFIYGIIVSVTMAYLFEKYFFHNTTEKFFQDVMLNSFINLAVDWLFVSLYYSLYLADYWQKSIENEEKLKRENLIARYEALKNQVNPHFLFNSLNTLSGIVETNQKDAVNYIKRLSNTYRYVLEQRDKELVTLEEELSFVKDYLYLATIRHGNGLVVNINVSAKISLLPPLGLQMLIENSIKHNAISDEAPLIIDINEIENHIIIRNNLQPKKVIQDSAPLGLENLKNRYAYLTDKPVIVEKTEEYFIVKIPLIEKSI
jgi:two-component system LytT family sensor kinase